MDVLFRVPGYTADPGIPVGEPGYPNRLTWTFPIQATEPHVYGSRFGWITIRQSQHDGYRESINIPVVVANVFNARAAVPGNELYFDLFVHDRAEDVAGRRLVARRQVRWGAGADVNETRHIGTFFSTDGDHLYFTPRITNRTGVRYLLQRYDMLPGTELLPSYWSYDLSPYPDLDLPHRILLDPRSQIAPGLVTVYPTTRVNTRVNATRDFFRIYPFPEQLYALHSLNITYRVVGGMTPLGTAYNGGNWTVSAFNLAVHNDPYRTFQNELRRHTGGEPFIAPPTHVFSSESVEEKYFRAGAFANNSFMISAAVPPDTVVSDTDADDTAAENVRARVPILPMRVRMQIARSDLTMAWEDILRLERAGTLAANLHLVCTVHLFSPHTPEIFTDLFQALRNRAREAGNRENYYMENVIVNAFTDFNNTLHIELMVLLADAESQNMDKTAFVQVVQHDTLYYALIGDGSQDGTWELGFFVAAAEPLRSPTGNGNDDGNGCNTGGLGMASFVTLMWLFIGSKISLRRRKT